MFVSTAKFTQRQLGDKFSLLFDVMHATTSVTNLNINVRCHKTDLPQVIEVLHDMIHTWKCPRSLFASEKKFILDEYKNDYESLEFTRGVLALAKDIPELKHRGIGTKPDLQALTYGRVKEAKKIWEAMLNKAPRDLIVMTETLTKSETKLLNSLVNLRMNQIPAAQPEKIKSARLINTETISAVQFFASRTSPFYLTLQRLYYVRGQAGHYNWYVDKLQEKNNIIFFVLHPKSVQADIKQSLTVLATTPTKAEFLDAQDIILKHVDTLADTVEAEKLIDWLHIFWLDGGPATQFKTLPEIKTVFKKYSYQNFLRDWKLAFTK